MARFAFGGSSVQTHPFSNSTEVTITHGLGHKPLIYVVSSDGKMCWADVTYTATRWWSGSKIQPLAPLWSDKLKMNLTPQNLE